MGQLSIVFKTPRPEIYGSVSTRIGMAFFYQRVYHIQHTAYFLCRLRMRRCRTYIQPLHVLFAFFNISFGNHGRINALLH